MVIVGAAATGVQLASIFAAFGTVVTLLEVAPRIVPGEDADISSALASGLSANGVRVLTGIRSVEEIRRHGRGLALRYRDEGDAHELEVDAVILAIGWPGNIEDIGLEAIGVRTERGYVLVDDELRTTSRMCGPPATSPGA